MDSVFRNKKGVVENLIFVLVALFFLAISLVIMVFVNEELTQVVSTTALNDTSVGPTIVEKMDIITNYSINNMFAWIAGAMVLFMMLSAFLARSHPVWFFIWLLVTGILIIAAAPMANMYQKLIEVDVFAASAASQQGAINYIMNHFVQFMIITGAISAFIALSRPETASFGGADI